MKAVWRPLHQIKSCSILFLIFISSHSIPCYAILRMSYTPFLMSVINECVPVPVSCVHKNERFSNLSLVSFLFSGFSPSGTAECSCPSCYHPIIPSSDKTYEISTHKKKNTQKKDRSYGVWRLYTIRIPYHYNASSH